ncbi:MAG: flagellar hook-basal body complex protein FliE, partial [Methylophagaceae bacterium]
NETQQAAGKLKTAFEMGDPNVSLADAMIASQKASVAFQATLQVRNKLVQAYEEVMRMSV